MFLKTSLSLSPPLSLSLSLSLTHACTHICMCACMCAHTHTQNEAAVLSLFQMYLIIITDLQVHLFCTYFISELEILYLGLPLTTIKFILTTNFMQPSHFIIVFNVTPFSLTHIYKSCVEWFQTACLESQIK